MESQTASHLPSYTYLIVWVAERIEGSGPNSVYDLRR